MTIKQIAKGIKMTFFPEKKISMPEKDIAQLDEMLTGLENAVRKQHDEDVECLQRSLQAIKLINSTLESDLDNHMTSAELKNVLNEVANILCGIDEKTEKAVFDLIKHFEEES